ncbi:MAG TPA: hypothetical protein VJW55_06265 [Candidatus Angelobacter sp.]|jgi:hypothetical protein|nr:hypothetical protein [Candidatus Angelobacter sp.]
MLLGVGGLDIGLLVEPGPVVLPGVHGVLDGAPATVVEVPAGCDGVLPATVEFPVLAVEGLAVELLGVELEVVELPMLVPLFAGVHGAGDATVGVVCV